MESALWISKTGLSAQDTKLGIISNNLANVSTTGFKKDRPVFQDLFYQISRQPGGQSSQNTVLPSGVQQGTGVRMVATQKVFSTGNLQVTDQPLDLAINGRGFLQVQMPDGNIGYTRDGQLQMDASGQLVTSGGLVIQPVISIASNVAHITIGTDGTVSTTDANGATTQVGQLQLADFSNPAGLEAQGDNLFKATTASGDAIIGTATVNGMGNVIQGSIENSNVNVVEELVNMIATQRAYEMNSKVISTVDQMLQYTVQNN